MNSRLDIHDNVLEDHVDKWALTLIEKLFPKFTVSVAIA